MLGVHTRVGCSCVCTYTCVNMCLISHSTKHVLGLYCVTLLQQGPLMKQGPLMRQGSLMRRGSLYTAAGLPLAGPSFGCSSMGACPCVCVLLYTYVHACVCMCICQSALVSVYVIVCICMRLLFSVHEGKRIKKSEGAYQVIHTNH